MKDITNKIQITMLSALLITVSNPLSAATLENDFNSDYPQYCGVTGENKICEKPIIDTVKTRTYQVPLNKSKRLRFKRMNGQAVIKVGNPKIAKLDRLPSNKILIQGISLGTTNIYVSGGNGQIAEVINIEVTHDLETLKYKLHELLPFENIDVRSLQHNIVLSGQVSGLDKMQWALDIAESYLPLAKAKQESKDQQQSAPTTINIDKTDSKKEDGPHVINMLGISGAHQVMLEVKVAEIDRTIAKGLNIQFNQFKPGSNFGFGALNGGGTFNHLLTDADAFSNTFSALGQGGGIVGPIASLFSQNEHSIDAAGIFLSAITGDFIFNLTVDAAKNQALAKILAEPVLTTLSGQEAKFISGGEFPVPVPQTSGNNGGTITIIFKEFGISLRFLPVVLDTGRINLNMHVSVSELSDDAAVATEIGGREIAFVIPSLTKREASSTLELADGQTMSIAGLISDTVRENVDKFPGLGDIPVLGALFRSEEFLKKQTELVIFVTPRLAKPVLQQDIVLPTDTFIEPDDLDFYLFGKLEARDAAEKVMLDRLIPTNTGSGGLDGQFGHELLNEEIQ
ncbi:MAG: type II and III secretion system protein family protein [Methylococcales bacterium]